MGWRLSAFSAPTRSGVQPPGAPSRPEPGLRVAFSIPLRSHHLPAARGGTLSARPFLRAPSPSWRPPRGSLGSRLRPLCCSRGNKPSPRGWSPHLPQPAPAPEEPGSEVGCTGALGPGRLLLAGLSQCPSIAPGLLVCRGEGKQVALWRVGNNCGRAEGLPQQTSVCPRLAWKERVAEGGSGARRGPARCLRATS